MMKHVASLLTVLALLTAPLIASPAGAAMMRPSVGSQQVKEAGPYRVVLAVMPAEPFYTAAQAMKMHGGSGMVIVGGAHPVPPSDASRPNHHLAVHVYSRATGQALRGAAVTLTYERVPGVFPLKHLPVVEMQAIGGGPGSTHYGNNVALAPGPYRVVAGINHTAAATFTIHV